jgi:hypothetical protein
VPEVAAVAVYTATAATSRPASGAGHGPRLTATKPTTRCLARDELVAARRSTACSSAAARACTFAIAVVASSVKAWNRSSPAGDSSPAFVHATIITPQAPLDDDRAAGGSLHAEPPEGGPARGHQFLYQRRIHRRPAPDHPLERVDELCHIGDAALQQVPGAMPARQQVHCVLDFNALAQQDVVIGQDEPCAAHIHPTIIGRTAVAASAPRALTNFLRRPTGVPMEGLLRELELDRVQRIGSAQQAAIAVRAGGAR